MLSGTTAQPICKSIKSVLCGTPENLYHPSFFEASMLNGAPGLDLSRFSRPLPVCFAEDCQQLPGDCLSGCPIWATYPFIALDTLRHLLQAVVVGIVHVSEVADEVSLLQPC